MSLVFSSQDMFDIEVSKVASEICDHVTTEMGAELHDDLIQKLSVIRLYIDRLDRSSHSREETEQLLILMRSDFDLVVESVRRISRKLMPILAENNSFNETVRLLCQNMDSQGFGNVHFEQTGIERPMPPTSQTHLSRITQELIHNAFKHSSAWHIWVRLNWKPSVLSMEVEDDGTGFNKIGEFIERLRKKHNTLRMRSELLKAPITYLHGMKGLVAKIELRV